MQSYLRFQCYNTPDRQTYTQIHSDIPVKEHPLFSYGQTVRVGDDAVDMVFWPQYVVATITHMKQIADPADLTKNALLFQVFLVRDEEWEQFGIPDEVQQMIDAQS